MFSKHIILTEWQHVSYTDYFRIIHNIILLKTGQFCERKKWHIAFMKFLSDLNLLAICNSSYKLCQALYSEMSLMMGLPKLTLTAKTWYSTAQFCLEIIEEAHALKFPVKTWECPMPGTEFLLPLPTPPQLFRCASRIEVGVLTEYFSDGNRSHPDQGSFQILTGKRLF